MRPWSVDFNTVLRILNFLIAIFVIVACLIDGVQLYTDRWSGILAVILAGQTEIVLYFEKRTRNPLVVVVAFVNIVYYLFRIGTLSVYSSSSTLMRFAAAPRDINNALIVILVMNAALYAGLMISKPRVNAITPGLWRPQSGWGAAGLLALATVSIYIPASATQFELPRAVSFIFSLLISQNIVIPMALAYYLLFHRRLATIPAIAIVALLLIESVLHFLAGSRSALQTLVVTYLITVLAINNAAQLKIRVLLVIALLMPALIPLTLGSFSVSTYIRASKQDKQFSITESIQMSKEYRAVESNASDQLAPLFNRMGFFDYSAELIIDRERYATVMKLANYFRSIVDNLLTPGFDIFDQPKISNSVRSVYQGGGTLTKSGLPDEYQSDQFGIYGELYVLFGYASVAIMFIVGLISSRIFSAVFSSDPFIHVMKRLAVITVFYSGLNSFGFDWLLIDTFALIVGIAFYERAFFMRIAPGRNAEGLASR